MEWLGQTEYIKSHYEEHVKGAQQMAEVCKEAEADMLVLKGLSLASMYPEPAAREFGDLDIFTFDAHDRVNEAIKTKGIEVEYWDKHDVFNLGNTHVEHHSYFVSKNSKAGKRINEKLLEIVARDKGVKVAENVYYPTPDFDAIFVLCHTIGHMSYEGATLKNVIDYGLVLQHCCSLEGKVLRQAQEPSKECLHWDEIASFLKEVKWDVGFNTLTRVAEKVLDVDFSRYYIGAPDETLADKVLDTILDTTLHQEADLPLPKRVIKKTQRLFSHRWMYSSGLIPANFWTDCVWGSLKEHLERPEQF